MISLTISDINDMSASEKKVLRAILDLGESVAVAQGEPEQERRLGTRRDDNLPLQNSARSQQCEATIAPQDNPAAGEATIKDVPRTEPVIAQADPAVVFGGGAAEVAPRPNDQNQTLIPPPSPLPNLPILPPPSSDATTASLPPPPPPAPAPAPASDAAPTTSGVPTDKSGLPWDSRIHASTKATIADGTWKKRRGVEPAEVVQVEAQLRAAMAIPAGGVAAVAVPDVWPFPKDSSSITGDAPPPPPPAEAVTFQTLMQFITPRITDGRLTQVQVTAAVASTGLASINLLMTRPDLVRPIMDALVAVAP